MHCEPFAGLIGLTATTQDRVVNRLRPEVIAFDRQVRPRHLTPCINSGGLRVNPRYPIVTTNDPRSPVSLLVTLNLSEWPASGRFVS